MYIWPCVLQIAYMFSKPHLNFGGKIASGFTYKRLCVQSIVCVNHGS